MVPVAQEQDINEASNEQSKIDFFFNTLHPDVKHSLSESQTEEIKRLIERILPKPSKKMVDIRFTFWFVKRMFAVFYLGVSKRKSERKIEGDSLQKFLALEFKVVFYILEIALSILVLMLVLYLIKMIFGFNIMEYIF